MEEERIKKAKQKNVKLYPIYKIFAWDLLFYYSIIFLFLNQAKGLDSASIVFGNAFYPIFKLVFQAFVPGIIHITGQRISNIIGNILVSLSILYIILASASVENLIISNLIMAIGYILKGVCESGILDECITDVEKKNSKFAKIDGRGSAYWYIFEAISSVTTGYLFVINAYIPMYMCFIFCIIGTIISCQFEPYEVKQERPKEEQGLKRLVSKMDLSWQEYKFIFKSRRLRALLLFSGLFYGMLFIRSTLTSSLLVDIGIPDKYFGIISGLFTIFAAITTWKQNVFHRLLHNKVLTVFSLLYTTSLIIVGLTIILNINYTATLVIVFIMMTIQNMIKGPYYTLIKRYLNSFTDPHLLVKIYSVNSIMEDVGGILISLVVSWLLGFRTTAYTSLFIGIGSLILFIFILEYMKTRIGLKPEEYRKADIEFIPKTKKDEIEKKEPVIEIAIGVNENGETSVDIK